MKTLALVMLLLGAACGDNLKGPPPTEQPPPQNPPPPLPPPPISYTDPSGGKLRLIRTSQTETSIALDLVVGDQPLTGYTVGFDLPFDDTKVKLDGFTPGSALNPGASPAAAMGVVSATGPLAHQLVTVQSQKASGMGAVTTNTTLPPGTVVYSIDLAVVQGQTGVVFDGTAPGFVLPSGGMRDRTGTTVVEAKDVSIGKLELH
jgi:hypothetical protein